MKLKKKSPTNGNEEEEQKHETSSPIQREMTEPSTHSPPTSHYYSSFPTNPPSEEHKRVSLFSLFFLFFRFIILLSLQEIQIIQCALAVEEEDFLVNLASRLIFVAIVLPSLKRNGEIIWKYSFDFVIYALEIIESGTQHHILSEL